MTWRTVVITGNAKLDYKMDYLVVRKTDDLYRIHLSEISLLIIESTSVSLTTFLLCELVKRKVKIIFCDEKHNPHSELVSYYGSHDTSGKVKNQIAWNDNIKKSVWTEIVTEKIRQQMIWLHYCGKTEQANLLKQYIAEMTYYDKTNREGHAAKVYFNALFGMEFTRAKECAVNSALNYGYEIILSLFAREIVACGYITQLGLFHDNMYNNFNLASDLMEPFRIMVDKCVMKLDPVKFEHDEKMKILSILSEEVIIDGKRNTVTNAIKIYTRSVFDALNDTDASKIKFYSDEL